MFRRLADKLPPDPEFPHDLQKLGYYINEKDQIRSIANPTQEFHYFISKNERVLELHREAMNACIRAALHPRFAATGLLTTRLHNSTPLPDTDTTTPHIPILASPNLATASRVLIYFGESEQDLGIFAYRTIGRESLKAGSILSLVEYVKSHEGSSLNGASWGDLALVIANPGQLFWHRRGGKAVTSVSWYALPRKSGVDPPMRIDPVKNRVPGHEDQGEHLRSVMEFVGKVVRRDVGVEMLATGDGALEVYQFLDKSWGVWGVRVRALVLGMGWMRKVVEDLRDEGFKKFLGRLTRAYLLHSEPAGTLLDGREIIGCNCFSSGEKDNEECIMPRAYLYMLDWFELVNSVPGYEERPVTAGVMEAEMAKVMQMTEAMRLKREAQRKSGTVEDVEEDE